MSISRRTASLFIVSALALSAAGCGGPGEGAKNPSDNGSHPLIGQPAPDFQLATVNGQGKVSIASLKGKVVLVDFWATWCEPCKKSFPKLQELNVKHKASGLEIVAVSTDESSSGVAEFGKTYGAKFPIALDEGGKNVASKWSPPTMPSSFVIDKKGIVRFVHVGYRDGDEAKIEQEVKGLL